MRQVQPQRELHELERGVDLMELRSADAHAPAEEGIVIFKRGGSLSLLWLWLWMWRIGSNGRIFCRMTLLAIVDGRFNFTLDLRKVEQQSKVAVVEGKNSLTCPMS